MNKYARHKKILTLVIFMVTFVYARGAQEHFYNSISGVHFAYDSTLTVQDDKYGTPLWSTIQKNLKVTDIITLQLNEDTALYLTAKHNLRVDLEITYYDSAGTADSLTTTLGINYDTTKSKRYNFRSSFKFNGAYKVKARILRVSYDSGSGSYPAVFILSGDIYISRVYDFSCGTSQTPSHSFDATNQRLNITWSPVTGADEYDLEFTSYDDSSQVSKDSASVDYTDISVLFTNNATRVTVQGIEYAISLVYNPGYIIYRIRPIHYDMYGNRIEGKWSSEVNTKLESFANRYHWHGHENGMNWQYEAAYAEQGKRKEVASYFDGSLRNRQSVTLNNTENKAIVGETIYDFQGRPAVTTLPAPIDSGKIIFYNKYNRDPSGAEYNSKDFDTGGCEYVPIGMDSVRGSSHYYSSSNPDTTTGFDRFLPDAQGYPFTMTEYTPDITGRISRQSIAGKTHRFGSGHETKYFYGKPAQVELDRLFGNEVGDFSHYMKNMVIDANGQISISYIDENGKTIATALAGQVPSNMQAISSYVTPTNLTVNLLDSAGNIYQNTSIYSGFTFLATNTGRYYFTYKLFPGNYTDPTCSSAPCTDCLYDIQLMVTGDCEGNTPLILHYDSNLTYKQAFDTNCGHDNIVDTFSVVLTAGNYNVSRLITVDPKAISYYTERDEKKNTCLKPYSDFLANAIANTDFSGCGMTCAACMSAIGADTTFVRKYIAELRSAGDTHPNHKDTVNADTAYNEALAQCNILCAGASNSLCTGLYDEMISDVSLGGQYCTYTLVAGNYQPGDTLSVLNHYQSPPSLPYRDEGGNPDSVVINGRKYAPQQLTLTQFVLNWKPSWAASFVSDHPEYCFYTTCISDSASNRYDINFESAQSYSTACSLGFLAPLGHFQHRNVCDTVNPDPYFQTGGNGVYYQSFMKHRIDQYLSFTVGSQHIVLSMWATAALMQYCSADTLSNQSMAGCYSASDTSMGSSCGAGTNNMEWTYFKGLYRSLKDSIQNLVDASKCSADANCIGEPSCPSPYNTKVPRHLTEEYAVSQSKIGPLSQNKADDIRYADSTITATCDSTCLNYAYSWYSALSGCGSILHTDSVRLIKRFLTLCEAGCNINHPLGASTTQYSLPDDSGDRDVEDILVHVLGVSRRDSLCDSLYISMPPPYNDSDAVGAPATYSTPSSCICAKLDTLLNHYYKPDSLSGDHTYTNFADYLNKNLGGSLADSTVYQVLANCKSGCFYLPYAFATPTWMTCCSDTSLQHTYSNPTLPWDTTVNVTQGCCILCSDIEEGMRIFAQVSPKGIDTMPTYQNLITNFLNDMYGFNLNFNEYYNFYTKCKSIHCTETVTTFTVSSGLGSYSETRSDSTCSGVTIIDTFYTNKPVYTWNTDSIRRYISGDPNGPCTTTTLTTYTNTAGDWEVVDSSCGGVTVLDTLFHMVGTIVWTLHNRHLYDSGAPCTSTVTTFTTSAGKIGERIDSSCNGITIIDSVYKTKLIHISGLKDRKVMGAKQDSLEPMLCNEPINEVVTPVNPTSDTNNCYTYLMMDAQYNAQTNYNNYIDSTANAFRAAYITHCMNVDDSFKMVMPYDMYHFTLYYYDQAENLVKTVPPQGVHPITSQTLLNDIANYRAGTYGTPTYPVDSLMTRYFYNTLNSPIKQQTPDGDSVHFWYDRLGRIALSQNKIQRPPWYWYSYTKYDALNRVNEVGQVATVPQNLPSCFVCNHCIIKYEVNPVLPDTFTRNQLELENFINLGTRTQIVHTYYDSVMFKYIPMQQQNLRKRIASITYKENNNNPNGERTNPDSIYSRPDSAAKDYDNAIHYSYDIEGNVSSMLIDVPHDSIVHQRYKRINYYYDLVSGNVNEIIYEPDSIDQFIHVYQYDADNRMTDVMTSRDSLYWENDASYEYYDDGPLARKVIGQRQVQGIDYAYTLNGWVKGVNSGLGSYKKLTWPPNDMGKDGYPHGANATIGRDAYGYVLNYFTGDYRSIARTSFATTGLPTTDLYNGNISGATYAIRTLSPAVIGYTYGYDQLNRLVSEVAFKGIDTVHNTWAATDNIQDLREAVSYDENGNILSYLRHGNTAVGPLAMDSMTYHYNLNTNQLREVNDAVTATNYTVDIDNETSKHNYRYNGIGELASDSIGGIDSIYWTVYGKIKKIVKTNGDSIVYFYDPMGERLEDRNFSHIGTSDTNKYARDAQGDVMAIYDRKKDTVRLSEFDIYGSMRLGSLDTILRMQKFITGHGTLDSLTISYLERQKQYELDNHLGNVLATVSDGKTPVDTNHDGIADYYLPIIIDAQDYYPFGMEQPGRSYNLTNDSSYRYGFNGDMKDNNINGNNNTYTTLNREYDDRLGRWWSVDPKVQMWQSPYSSMDDNPILYSDPNGDVIRVLTKSGVYLFSLDDGKSQITTMSVQQLYNLGAQWFEPLADNYYPLIDISSNVEMDPAVLHFTWDQIANFATTDRFMLQYRPHGSGDWKASPEGGNGYYLVTVDGMPYWASAVGNIAFAVNYFHDEFSRTGNYQEAVKATVHMGIVFGHGCSIFNPDYSNTVDNYFMLRGALWAGQYYRLGSPKFFGGYNLTTTNYSPNMLGTSISSYVKTEYLSMLKSNNYTSHTSGTENTSKYRKHKNRKQKKSKTKASKGSHCSVRYPCCFVGTTKIMMANGSVKNIEDIKIGDTVKGMDIYTFKVINERIYDTSSPIRQGLVKISFSNGGNNLNTYDHSYFVIGKGWCSYKPSLTKNNYNINAQKLAVGDTVIQIVKGILEKVRVNSIYKIDTICRTYNIFTVGNDYFANGILVYDEGTKYLSDEESKVITEGIESTKNGNYIHHKSIPK